MKIIQTSLSVILMLSFASVAAYGQVATSINQNFDVACVYNTNFPAQWMRYNSIPATFQKGAWSCAAEDGRDTTPGLKCSGYYDNAFHKDTAYLITPRINLADYANGSVFLQYDTRTSSVSNGSSLSVFVSYDDIFTSTDPDIDTPRLIGVDDTGWHTHQVNLSGYENNVNFFIGFRYISNATFGSTWYIDNVKTTTARLAIPDPAKLVLSLCILGAPVRENITLSYSVAAAGLYSISIYDMMGKQVYQEALTARAGISTHTINRLDLRPGMYCVRFGNSNDYSVVRTIVR